MKVILDGWREFAENSMWVLSLFLMVTIDTIGNAVANYWQLHGHKLPYALVALGLFLLANVMLLFMLKNHSGLGRAVVSFGVLSAITGLAVAIFVYHESYNLTQIIGLTLGLTSLFLLY